MSDGGGWSDDMSAGRAVLRERVATPCVRRRLSRVSRCSGVSTVPCLSLLRALPCSASAINLLEGVLQALQTTSPRYTTVRNRFPRSGRSQWSLLVIFVGCTLSTPRGGFIGREVGCVSSGWLNPQHPSRGLHWAVGWLHKQWGQGRQGVAGAMGNEGNGRRGEVVSERGE